MAAKKTVAQPPTGNGDVVIQRSLEDVMHDSMMPYSEHVILERALPRVEDGLKPVQRRILFTMLELANTPDKPHRKCARIVGDCLGKYHPHGDSSVYDALARLAQPFVMRAPLVDGHGNFGSVDGDSPAAMRYTEARMTALSQELLRDIEKDTVPFRLNFDDTQKEPDMLPARFPNLLVNGASGIAVGLATNMPPHNLREAIAAVCLRMDEPNCSLEALMKVLPAPDFPTGGMLVNDGEVKAAYATGRGKLRLRARVNIEPGPGGKKLLVITEIPYQVSKAAMLEKILRLSEEKKAQLGTINDIRDESDRTGMRAVIELKREADPARVLKCLYKYSDLQVTYGVNMVAIADGKPLQLPLTSILDYYIKYQKDVVTRRTRFELNEARVRAHILDGLVVAIDNIDEVIRLIRASKNGKEAKAALMSAFGLTDVQAQAILDLRLQRLTNLESLDIRNERARLQKLIDSLESILGSEKKLAALIKKEMLAIAESYGDDRRTELIADAPDEVEIAPEEEEAREACVALTSAGFIKRLAPRALDKPVEPIDFGFNTDDSAKLLFFTDAGNCFQLPVKQLTECRPKDRGQPPAALLGGLEKEERIIHCLCLRPDAWLGDLLLVTEKGMVKRVPLAEYDVRKSRYAAISLKNGDRLASVTGVNEEEPPLLLVTRKGMAIRFELGEVPRVGRAAAGVKGIALAEGDAVVLACVADDEGELMLITDRGYCKRCLMADFDAQGRGGKGVKCLTFVKNGANGANVVCARRVREPFDFEIVQKSGARSPLNTEDIRIETRIGKGAPCAVVVMDDLVTGINQL